jgi:two-component system OmpR family response regulator
MTAALSILYVDDEPDIRLIVEMALSMRPGLSVRTAESGDEALDLMLRQGWLPDVVMVDVMMPGVTGLDLLAALRAEPATETLPVIFVTARARPQDIAAYIAQGAKGVITKPFDPMHLVDQVLALAR